MRLITIIKRIILITILMLCIAFVSVELGLRAMQWMPDVTTPRRTFEGQAGDWQLNSKTLLTVESERPYLMTINDVGSRNTQNYNPDAYTILAIGDSQTYGFWLPDDDTWPAWYANMSGYQVLNLGVAGTSLPYYNTLLNDLTFKNIDADLVIYMAYANDISDYNFYTRRPRYINYRIDWSRHFAFAGWVQDISARRAEPRQSTYPLHLDITYGNAQQWSWNAYEQDLIRLHNLITSHDAELVIALLPEYLQVADSQTYNRQWQDFVIDIAQRQGITTIDLLPVYQQYDVVMLYWMQHDDTAPYVPYSGNGHISRAGAYLAAEAIYNQLNQ